MHVLIASYLDDEDVRRIAQVDPCIEVLHEPDLLPVPRYVSDHKGTPRDLSASQATRWDSLLGRADVSFDFDWRHPEKLRDTAPNLRWIQGTSSGIGELLVSTGLISTDIIFTTAAGVHAVPLVDRRAG